MKFLRQIKYNIEDEQEDDPMAGVAQLFDVSVAFIVAVIMALFTLLSANKLLDKNSDWTIVRKNKSGDTEVIEKKDNKIISHKITTKQLSGNGTRLGTAYRLSNGQIVYVPDSTKQ